MKASVEKWLTEQLGGDDRDLLESVYAEYCATAAGKLSELRRFAEAGQMEEMRPTLHAMKGAALTVGDAEFADLVIAARERVIAGDKAGVAADIEKMGVLISNL